jgi:citrate lyase beta subunit
MMSPLQLGASLYVPATRPDVLAIGAGERFPWLRSVIFDTEDAIRPREVLAALDNLATALRRFEPSPLLRFVRVRDSGVLRELLSMDGVHQLAGFVLPKATRRNLPEFFAAFRPEHGYRVMVTLETAEVFDPAEMAALRGMLLEEPYRRRLLSLRVGGNDLLQLLGLRRPRGRSIYATPLGAVIAQLVTTFRPHGLNLTGPVFEHLDDSTTLKRETRRDLACGLFGKSAIHPEQVPLIESQYRVAAEELRFAERILADGAAPVFRYDGAMAEPATHRRWAETIVECTKLYGVRGKPTRAHSLPPANGHPHHS